jgi:hypothetical protein
MPLEEQRLGLSESAGFDQAPSKATTRIANRHMSGAGTFEPPPAPHENWFGPRVSFNNSFAAPTLSRLCATVGWTRPNARTRMSSERSRNVSASRTRRWLCADFRGF